MKSKMEKIISNGVSITKEFIGFTGCRGDDENKTTGATGMATGETGMATGETGTATGETGCSYDISTTFINLYSFSNEIPHGNEYIVFNTTTAYNGNCGHCEDDSNIWIWETGHFYFHIYTNNKEPYTFSILKNDVPVPIKPHTTNTSNNYYTTIVEILPNDLILSNPFVDELGCKINVVVRSSIDNHNDNRISFMYHYEKEGNGWYLTPYISTNVCIILLQK